MAEATVNINKNSLGYMISIVIEGETKTFFQKKEELFGFAKSIKDEQFKKAFDLVKADIGIVVLPKELVETFDETVLRLTEELKSKELAISVATNMPTKPVFVPKETIEEIITRIESKKYTV